MIDPSPTAPTRTPPDAPAQRPADAGRRSLTPVPPAEGEPRRVFIAWGAIAGRTHELAAEVGAEVLSCFPPGSGPRPPALVRYALSAARTVGYLLRHRPRAVLVTNPPVIPALLATVYAAFSGAVVVLDDHPGAFGAMGYRPGRYLRPLHRWAAGRARLCLVTDEKWAAVVESWGGRGLVLHEAPGSLVPAPPRPCPTVPRVLFVCTFGRDEPAAALLEAAALLPGYRFEVTGDPRRCPPVEVPANASLVGFLDPREYRAALDRADVVISLTTEPTSAMRAAFEAVWMEKVLVVSDWPLLRRLFPEAVHVGNDAEAIAAGVRRAVSDHARLGRAAQQMRAAQERRWSQQLSDLRSTLESGVIS